MANHDEFEEEEFTTQFNGGTLRRVLGLLKPHWKWVTGFLIAIGITAFLDSIFTLLGKRMVDDAIIPGNTAVLYQTVAVYAGLVIVQAALVLGFIFMAGILGERVQYDLRKKLFNHLQELSFSYFGRTPVGWIMSRVTSDSERIAQLVTWGMLDVVWAVISVTSSLIFMALINWRLALVVLVLIPILLVVAVWFKTRILVEYRNVRKLNSKLTGEYNQNITGVRVVKALGREQANLDEFSVLASNMYRASFRAAWLSALFLPAVQIISAVAVGSIVVAGGLQASYGGLTVGVIQAFVSYVTFMMWPIQDLARVYADMQHAIASAERSFSLVDAQPEVADKPGAMDPGTIRGEIEFDHVDFWYEEGKPVLSDFSAKIQAGETIALVGPTGGGKSTIVNLVSRFYEPKAGTIRIGGRDYTELTLHAIHSRLGVVLQTPHLFSGTIRENLRYGRLDATDQEIEDAAQLAGAHDFIITLEKGYDAEVGEGGNRLSVGQKQLISLARAVLARPEIFIMDEATSSVDTVTEALIQRGMEQLMEGRTTFVIAHRLSTIKRADRILVIENGGISEMGTHAELLRKRGHYYKLYTQQFRQERAVEYQELFGELAVVTA
jgi:ATP-binding cassette subfamily B protein